MLMRTHLVACSFFVPFVFPSLSTAGLFKQLVKYVSLSDSSCSTSLPCMLLGDLSGDTIFAVQETVCLCAQSVHQTREHVQLSVSPGLLPLLCLFCPWCPSPSPPPHPWCFPPTSPRSLSPELFQQLFSMSTSPVPLHADHVC